MEKNRAASPQAGPRPWIAPGPAPWRTLLTLAGLLLVIHLYLLLGLPWRTAPAPVLATPALVTRTLPATSAALPSQAAPPAPAVRRPPLAPRARPAPLASEVESPHTSAPAPLPVSEGGAVPAAPQVADSVPAVEPALTSTPPTPFASALPVEAPAVAAPASVVLPQSFRLKYRLQGEVRGFPYSAGAELLWSHDGRQYEAQLEISALFLGSRRQTSRGQLSPSGLAPKRFSDKVRSEVAAHFEYDKGVVIFSANTPQASLQPGAQDQLSIFIQLAGLIAAAPARYGPGQVLEMQAVGPRESDTWRFVVDGPQTLELPGGTQAALQLTRAARQPYELTVGLWLAPALGYLPVRIRLTQDNGDFVDMQWRSSAPP